VALANLIRAAGGHEILVELDMCGRTVRACRRAVAVPSSVENGRLFRPILQNEITVSANLDLDAFTVPLGRVNVTVENSGRIQDLEVSRSADGGECRVYLWAEGATWEDISEAGLIFSGTVQKLRHDRFTYEISAVERSRSTWGQVPGVAVTPGTWPNLRTGSAAGSSAGRVVPLCLGVFGAALPLICVNEALSVYAVCLGGVLSSDADYTAGDVNVYKAGNTLVDPAGYVFSIVQDGAGNPTAVFTFAAPPSSADEPYFCSISAGYDGTGEYTGSAGSAFSHPADIVNYLMAVHGPGNADIESLRTMRSLLFGFGFSFAAVSQADCLDLVQRLLWQCRAALVPVPGGRVGVAVFGANSPLAGSIDSATGVLGRGVEVARTPASWLQNNVEFRYDYNWAFSAWGASFAPGPADSALVAASRAEFGTTPRIQVDLPDVRTDAAVRLCAWRWLWLHAYPRDLVSLALPAASALSFRPGESLLLTAPEGPGGWTDEKFIVTGRTFGQKNAGLTLLRAGW
jgi:hypothetical protein